MKSEPKTYREEGSQGDNRIGQSEFITRGVGFAILCAITAFIAIWLSTQGAKALQPVKQLLPALAQTPDLARFRADAWNLPNEKLLGFVEIPAGAFTMGSDPQVDRQAFANERWSNESFQGTVELPTFFIGRYEVTVAQFHAFASATGYPASAESLRSEPTHPVTAVAWTDALAYARWLDTALADLLRDGWSVSVPTEAQWEKAARGSDGRIYPWGATPDRENANFAATNTLAVGSKKCVACVFQLADMSGNVWELTRSPYRPYPYDDNHVGDTAADALYVMRGGSFNDAAGNVRAAIRGGIDPGARRPFIGFRVVIAKSN